MKISRERTAWIMYISGAILILVAVYGFESSGFVVWLAAGVGLASMALGGFLKQAPADHLWKPTYVASWSLVLVGIALAFGTRIVVYPTAEDLSFTLSMIGVFGAAVGVTVIDRFRGADRDTEAKQVRYQAGYVSLVFLLAFLLFAFLVSTLYSFPVEPELLFGSLVILSVLVFFAARTWYYSELG